MPRYSVNVSFMAPALLERLSIVQRLPGRAGSMRLIGSGGMVTVAASRVPAESPAEAALVVVSAAQERWARNRAGRGPLIMRSWTAHRDRVLLGSRRGGGTSRSVQRRLGGGDGGQSLGVRPWDGDGYGGDGFSGGSAGVREPRRPLPGPGSLHAAAELPARPLPGAEF